MKILILTYYFPPAGGSGVQRWLKFVKYLPEFNVKPVVFTVKDANYPIIDKSLINEIPKGIEIIKQPIFEPNNFFTKNNKQSAGFLQDKPSFIGKIVQYIRANYFIPDARKFWIKPSVKYLSNYLKNNKIDAIITTGPPHSVHLIGLKLKQKFPVKWLADFRDPWTDIDYFHKLPLTKRAKKTHFKLEKKVVQNADTVLVVGKTMQKKYLHLNKNTVVITNGYDDFKSETEVITKDQKFSLLHIGMLNSDRNHNMLWRVLAELCFEIEGFKADLQIKLIGKVCSETLAEINDKQLQKNIIHLDYVKHQEVFKHQKAAQVLLLLINNVPSAKGIITGKIFEYLQAKRPILAIAPTDGDLAEIINSTQAGSVVDFNDAEKLKKTILSLYIKYKNNTLVLCPKNIEQYHRKKLTEKLVEIL